MNLPPVDWKLSPAAVMELQSQWAQQITAEGSQRCGASANATGFLL
jgi:hypothetical protein